MYDLPASITVSPTVVGVSVLTEDGVTVLVSLPRLKGLHDLPDEVVAERARTWARAALATAAETLRV
jgi:hypothetical protein